MREISALLFIFVTVFVFLILFVYLIDNAACENKSRSFDSHEYFLLGGCMVEVNGKMIPLDNVRGIDLKPENVDVN